MKGLGEKLTPRQEEAIFSIPSGTPEEVRAAIDEAAALMKQAV